jgi:hypothetical protein
MRLTILTLGAATLFAACAAAGPSDGTHRGTPTTTVVQTGAGEYELTMTPETHTSSHWVRAPREDVWAALPEVYADLGISPETIVSERWLVGNRDVRVRRIAGERPARFLDCGTNPIGAPNANTATIHLEITTRLQGIGDGTEVATTLVGRARPRTGGSSEVQCTTTGQLEALIAERLEEQTAGTGGSQGGR